ncbi:MAG: FAD:protein FMN transferase [Candidatus Omnitrophica bacterium]|nr:FAD:protein FMN transferase [Candidatus Omnitrophota bacterium]
MMDTYVTIYAIGPEKITKPAVNSALDRMQLIDKKMNPINPESELYKFNAQGTPIRDAEILDLIRIALEVSAATEGAFDITAFPLSELWGFSRFSEEEPRLPADEEIKKTLKNIGYKHLILSDGKLEKDNKDVAIDLGGIAKGYAIEQAVKVLQSQGVTSALIDAGGDIYALGSKINKPWQVGIQAPRGEELLGYLEVKDLAVMGSGDYHRFFIKDGKRYHHIFNLKTGYPADEISGITVIHPNPVLADCLATALFAMGPKEGIEFAQSMKGLETIMITASGEVLSSTGLKNALKVIPKDE